MTNNFSIPESDAEGIISLWQKVFGDSREFIEGYLTRFAQPGNYIIDRNEAGETIAMAHYPTFTSADGHTYTYLYAVAVDPRYRGHGIASKMIQQIITDTNADFVATIPASETLQRWYAAQFGFEYPGFHVPILDKLDFDLGTGDRVTNVFMVVTKRRKR